MTKQKYIVTERPKKNIIDKPSSSTKMLLKSWFIGLLNNEPRVKAHHFESIRIFFKGLGNESETFLSHILEPEECKSYRG